jgi:cation transport ATPase
MVNGVMGAAGPFPFAPLAPWAAAVPVPIASAAMAASTVFMSINSLRWKRPTHAVAGRQVELLLDELDFFHDR